MKTGRRPLKLALVTSALCCALAPPSLSGARQADGRGIGLVNIRVEDGREVRLYERSYALVIGVSDYTQGWPKLPGVKKDIEEVARALERHGFQVTKVENPDSAQLDKSFKAFIDAYGRGIENRLVFYFAGHGHTVKQSYGEEMGYIVPADAPLPSRDEPGFMSKAMDMQQTELYARRVQSKHALFLFDSCFPGALFALSRAVPDAITYKTARPVRQFITSGSADEQVPDQSIFRHQFVEALDGEADLNRDGYVTGTELGEFLQDKVINYSRNAQHPQYGKLRNPNLDKGDFVFALPKAPPPVTTVATPTPARPTPTPTPARVDPAAVGTQPKSDTPTSETVRMKDGQIIRGQLASYGDGQFTILIGGDSGGRRSRITVHVEDVESTEFGVATGGTMRLKDGNVVRGRFVAYGGGQFTLNTGSGAAGRRVTFNAGQVESIAFDSAAGEGTGGSATPPAGAARDSTASPSPTPPKPGAVIRTRSGIELVYVPPGTFMMGSERWEEKPVHRVTIRAGFWMGKYEVTQAQWQALMGNNPSGFKGCDNCPVEQVSWNDVQLFIRKLNAQNDGLSYRLPSEAEWEYACRAGTTGDYAGVLDEMAWYRVNSDNKAHPVGQKRPNGFGLYDTHGNVWEMVQDYWHTNYAGAPTDGSAWLKDGVPDTKIARGGGWIFDASHLRSSFRGSIRMTDNSSSTGFRLAAVARQ